MWSLRVNVPSFAYSSTIKQDQDKEMASATFHIRRPKPSSSNIPTARHLNGLTIDIREQRTRNSQNRSRRLRRRARPPERNIREPASRAGLDLLPRNAERDARAVRRGNVAAELLGSSKARGNLAERNGVDAHAELRAPLLGQRLGQARHAGLGDRIVDLPGVAVRAARRGDVDDVARLPVLDAEVRRRRTDQLEGRAGVQVEDRVPLLVRRLVACASLAFVSGLGLW